MPVETSQQHDNQLAPTVFIGCSSAALKHAEKIKETVGAGGEIEARLWNENLFDLGSNVLDDLLRYVSLFDFAVLVLTADDFTSGGMAQEGKPSPRDNVIFELGLFMGVRGRERAYVVVVAENKDALKIPSDLDGNTMLLLHPEKLDDNVYLQREIEHLRSSIRSEAKSAALSLLPSAALANGYYHNFLVPAHAHLLAQEQVVIDGNSHQIENGDYELVIVLPSSLTQASIAQRNRYVRTKQLKQYTFVESNREYGLFVYPPQADGFVRFVDYPTTLRSSAEIVNLCLQDSSRRMGRSERLANMEEQMGRQEITNFRKALDWLMIKNENEKPEIREKTTYDYVGVANPPRG